MLNKIMNKYNEINIFILSQAVNSMHIKCE